MLCKLLPIPPPAIDNRKNTWYNISIPFGNGVGLELPHMTTITKSQTKVNPSEEKLVKYLKDLKAELEQLIRINEVAAEASTIADTVAKLNAAGVPTQNGSGEWNQGRVVQLRQRQKLSIDEETMDTLRSLLRVLS